PAPRQPDLPDPADRGRGGAAAAEPGPALVDVLAPDRPVLAARAGLLRDRAAARRCDRLADPAAARAGGGPRDRGRSRLRHADLRADGAVRDAHLRPAA